MSASTLLSLSIHSYTADKITESSPLLLSLSIHRYIADKITEGMRFYFVCKTYCSPSSQLAGGTVGNSVQSLLEEGCECVLFSGDDDPSLPPSLSLSLFSDSQYSSRTLEPPFWNACKRSVIHLCTHEFSCVTVTMSLKEALSDPTWVQSTIAKYMAYARMCNL